MAKEKCLICDGECGLLNSNKIKKAQRRLCFKCQSVITGHNKINEHLFVLNMGKISAEEVVELYNNPQLSVHDFYRTEKTEKTLKMFMEMEEAKKPREEEPLLAFKGMCYEDIKVEAQKTTKRRCIVCNKECGILDSKKLKDETFMCFSCQDIIKKHNDTNRKISSFMNELTGEQIRELFVNHQLTIHDFYRTEKTEMVLKNVTEVEEEMYQKEHTRKFLGVSFNDVTKEISFGTVDYLKDLFLDGDIPPTKYPYSSLVKYEYKEGENTITQGGSGLGRAIVGGLLFGGAGAIVGAATRTRTQKSVVSDMSVFITFDLNGKRYLKKVKINEFLDNELKFGSMQYVQYMKQVEQLIGILDDIYFTYHKEETQQTTENKVEPVSSADEIRKFKTLLDDGIITPEEFDKKKKQLLGI